MYMYMYIDAMLLHIHLKIHRRNKLTWHDGLIPLEEIWVKIGGDEGGQHSKPLFSCVMLQSPTPFKTPVPLRYLRLEIVQQTSMLLWTITRNKSDTCRHWNGGRCAYIQNLWKVHVPVYVHVHVHTSFPQRKECSCLLVWGLRVSVPSVCTEFQERKVRR